MSTQPTDSSPASQIARWLHSVRSTAWAMLIAQRLGWLLAIVLLAVLIGGVLDYFLRAPSWLRSLGLIGAAGTFGYALWVWLVPAWRFKPSLTEIALRVERLDEQRGEHSGQADSRPAVRGVLASGFELSTSANEASPNQTMQHGLAAPVVEAAAKAIETIRPREVFSTRPTLRAIGGLSAILMAIIALFGARPELVQIGAARMLLPWVGAQWPKRTQIADATQVRYHPLGSALALRAALVQSELAADDARITVRYRLLTGGTPGPWRSAALNRQNQQVSVLGADALGAPATLTGTLFDRLIEPTGLTPSPARGSVEPSEVGELEYWFESFDDQTQAARVALIDPPSLLRAQATITLPGYAARVLGTPSDAGDSGTLVQTHDLGSGSDDRAVPAPILAGSRVSVKLEFNKPLEIPAGLGNTEGASDWLIATLGPDIAGLFAPAATTKEPPTLVGNGTSWTLSWQHWETLRMLVRPTDEYRIASTEEAVFRFDVLKDNPPSATVTQPMEDKSVLPTAVVNLEAEGRDDVAMQSIALERQLARRAKSEGAIAEATGEPVEINRIGATAETPAKPGETPTPPKRLVTQATLDLSTIPGLQPGDEIWITGVATDAFELGGQTHEPVRSSVRKLRILSREQLVEQIWSDLGSVRRTAIKIDEDQRELSQSAPKPGPEGEDQSRRAERGQAALSERLSRQNQSIRELQDRVRENALPDVAIGEVLKQAGEMLSRAGQQSGSASQRLGEAAQQQATENASPEAGKPQLEESQKAQENVRNELAELIDMLDQGEDTFASKRAIERIIDQQKGLQQRTGEAGQATAGKTEAQLSPEQKQQLSEVAQQQESLSEDLRDAVRKMLERTEKLSKTDPAAAQAMQQAARRAQRSQTAEKMQQAAQQARQNQTNTAQQQQQQAIEDLENVLNELNQAQKNRDEVLRRALASLIESIEGLIRQQEINLAALKDAEPAGMAAVAALEPGMTQLHTNTLGVMNESSDAPREAAPALDELEKASQSMALSIPELRESAAAKARGHETDALNALKAALEAARKVDQGAQDRQNARKRAELRAKYEEALKTQITLRDSAQGLVGAEDNRRNKASARMLAQEQAQLKDTLDKLRQDVKEVSSAAVFNFAHDRLGELMFGASDALAQGLPDDAVVRAQTSAARLLKSLADALKDRKKPDDPFRTPEQGGGGGGSGGQPPPVVPPAAELVLLRLMQQEALDLSRTAAEAAKPDAKLVSEAAKLQQDLSDQGQALLKKLTERGGPEGAPKPMMKPEDPIEPEQPKPEGGAEE